MGKRCLIISGGVFEAFPEQLPQWDYVIACDKGYEYAARYGITPDLIVGDFDSATVRPEQKSGVLEYSVMKDDTDTMLAAKIALEKGFSELCFLCAFGGRLDHTLGNLQTGALAAEQGALAVFLGEETEAYIFSGRTAHIPQKNGWSLSCIALSDRVSDLTIRGTKFEAEHISLTNRSTLGISNVWNGRAASISCGEGILMVLCSRLKKGEHI